MAERKSVKDKVAAAQSRPRKPRAADGEASRKAPPPPPQSDKSAFGQLVDDHPFAVVAGGLALGMLAATVMPRKFSKQAWALAALAGEVGMTMGTKALDNMADASRASREHIGEWTETMIDQSAEARKMTGEFLENAASTARESGEEFVRRMLDWSGRIGK